MSYSNEVILDLFFIHGESQRVVERTCRTFNEKYPHLPKMTRAKFRKLRNKFINYGSVNSKKKRAKLVTESDVNIINVLGFFHAYPRASIPSAVEALGISQSSIHRILKKNKMHNYKFTRVQALLPDDLQQRTNFCEMLLVKIQEDPNFLQKVIWTDEAKFTREGIFNTRNNHFWADNNPHMIRERSFQQQFSLNVYCLLKDGRLNYKIYDNNLNGERYVDILNSTVIDFLEDLPIAERVTCWYQLDGAPAHCTNNVSVVLTDLFENRWLRRLGPWSWPARSPDLTPLDFFLWGVLKTKVYETPVQTIGDLRQRIVLSFQEIRPEEIRKAILSVESRVLKCLEVNGGHFEQFP